MDYFSEFDLIISYLYDPDKIFQTNVGRCSPAQFIVGPFRVEENDRVHATQVFLKPLERLAIFDADPVPQLRLETAGSDQPWGEGRCNTLALHPGSGSEKKNWPAERWADLLAGLVNFTSCNLLLVGGEAEGERLQWLAAALPPARTRVAQNLPLTQLGGLLSRCSGFVPERFCDRASERCLDRTSIGRRHGRNLRFRRDADGRDVAHSDRATGVSVMPRRVCEMRHDGSRPSRMASLRSGPNEPIR